MCRLLGYVSRETTTLSDLLGEVELAEFTELSRKHADGWGFAWPGERGIEVVKSPDAAWSSALFRETSVDRTADLGLLHLRWATLGLPVMPENTHPFTDGSIAFAHNGSIKPPTDLDALIPEDLAGLRRGTTDSERYFLAVAARMRGSDAEHGLAGTVEEIASSAYFTSLNAMVATEKQLIAVSRFDPAAEAREADEDYYQLHYRVTGTAVVVSSNGWGSGWQTLQNGQMLVVERETLEVTVRDLEHAPS